MEREWELFLAPYEQAVSELKVKLRGIRKQFREQDKHIPIEFVTGRVKPVDSILTKTVALLRNRKDLKIVEERDYIENKKESGYRSYHVVVEYPVQLVTGEKIILAEIQIRTLSMNFWATIEHSLNYKYQGVFPEEMKERLQRAAEAAYLLDEEMSSIREEIQEAQHYFSHGRGLLENEYYKQIKNETPENQ